MRQYIVTISLTINAHDVDGATETADAVCDDIEAMVYGVGDVLVQNVEEIE